MNATMTPEAPFPAGGPANGPANGPERIGPYRVDGRLGEGAMSVVYAAHDEDGGELAIKVLRGELVAESERRSSFRRFLREAEIGRRLIHPRIVRVLGHGEAEMAPSLVAPYLVAPYLVAPYLVAPYLVMERIRGRELRDLIDAGGPERASQAAAILRAVLEALAYAHANGVVHRDVKPTNVMLEEGNEPKLMDFGIALLPDSDLTLPGDLLGTPAYMAPEQIRGEGADARADLFSTGVIFYTLLAGRRPFNGSIAQVMQEILTLDPPPPSAVTRRAPRAFDAVIATALAKSPDQRFASAEAFIAALDRALAEAQAQAGESAPEPPRAGPEDREEGGAVLLPDEIAATLCVVLMRLGEAGLSERTLAEAEALIEAWFDEDPAFVPTREERQRMRAVLLDDGMTPLAALIEAGAPAPLVSRPRADWMRLLRLFSRLGDGAEALGAGAAAGKLSRRVAATLQEALIVYADRLSAILAGEDEPDLDQLSHDFWRLDLLLLGLEILGADLALKEARRAVTSFAGRVMRKVNDTLARHLAGGDGGEEAQVIRFGAMQVLARVEDLLVMAERLSKPSARNRQADLGQAEITAFVAHARALAALTVGELMAASPRTSPDG